MACGVTHVKRAALAFLAVLLTGALGCSQIPADTEGQVVVLQSAAPNGESSGETVALSGVAGLIFTEAASNTRETGAYEGCEGQDWFELYNGSGAAANLSGYSVSDDPEHPRKALLPEITLEAGGYLKLCCCGGTAHYSVALGLSQYGDALYLYAPDGALLDTLELPALDKDVSWAKAGESWGYCMKPTPGEANSTPVFASLEAVPMTDFSGLQLSELLTDNQYGLKDSAGNRFDYVELYNAGPEVSLLGWYLSDSSSNLTKYAFPDVTIETGEYLIVYLASGESDAGELYAGFSVSAGEEGIFLFNAETMLYDAILQPALTRADVSLGRNGVYYLTPTPGKKNGEPVTDISALGVFSSDSAYISEVCAIPTDGGNDWIELYNGSSASINLEGWSLSDDLETPGKLPLSGFLQAGSYLVAETTSHTSKQGNGVGVFGISGAGETLYLFDDTGAVRDVFKTGVLNTGETSGRIEGNDQISRVFFLSATKGKANSGSCVQGRAVEPHFSETGLYQTGSFQLVLTAEAGETIHYTTDGSEPNASSKVYTEPVTVSKNTVIRAMCTATGLLESRAVTYTYLFEEQHTLPVVCISLSPEDKRTVWSAKSKQSDTKVEREGYLSYYEADGGLGCSFPAGFKAKGAGTLGYSQPSLSIHLRGTYGQSSVTYPFFSEYGWQSYASLCIRNSGQDYSTARIRDSFASRLCLGLNLDVAATRPVAVYVNGEYYGLYDLNEDQNADYLNGHYGVDNDLVEIIRFNQTVVKGSNKNWKQVIAYAKSKDFSRDSVLEAFSEWVDTDCFMDYLAVETYLCNSDMANQKYWHTTDNAVRWRPLFYDFDYGMGFSGSASRNILPAFFSEDGTATATSTIYTYIACALIKNKSWKEAFLKRYVELIYTTFDADRAIGILDTLQQEMATEMTRHISRWSKPKSYSSWEKEVEEIRSWMRARPEYALKNLQSYFRLSDSEMAALTAPYK